MIRKYIVGIMLCCVVMSVGSSLCAQVPRKEKPVGEILPDGVPDDDVETVAKTDNRSTTAGANMIINAAPEDLARAIVPGCPVAVMREGKEITFREVKPGLLEHVGNDLISRIEYGQEKEYNVLWYQVSFENLTDKPLKGLLVKPLNLQINTDFPKSWPAVRYMNGAYRGELGRVYPSELFEMNERVFIPDDAGGMLDIARAPIRIGCHVNTMKYSVMMQFALQSTEKNSGFMVTFEWNGAWSMQAGLNRMTDGFEILGDMNLGDFVVPPKKKINTPRVTMIFFEGKDWTPLEHACHRYIREKITYSKAPLAKTNKVTYDSWFYLTHNFDAELMRRVANRAEELGCEYFVVDATWFGKGEFGASGKGVWDKPCPVKFPGGVAEMQALSKLCRDKGMGFGLWSYVADKNGDTSVPPDDLGTPEGVEASYNTLSNWIKTYDMTWLRQEFYARTKVTRDLNYWLGSNEYMSRILAEFPNFHHEVCQGGAQRLNFDIMRTGTSTWLTDFIDNPDLCRSTILNALRLWPSYMLNSGIGIKSEVSCDVRDQGGVCKMHPVGIKSGEPQDYRATAYDFISRMPGAIIFGGDLTLWSDGAVKRMRDLVDIYKSIRHLQNQPVFFPLPQIRSVRDWDAVCFGDGKGEAQLLYTYSMYGPQSQFIKVPDAKGKWSLLTCSENAKDFKIKKSGEGFVVSMPPHTAAVWIRK